MAHEGFEEELLVRRAHQRVDLHQRRVLGDEGRPQLDDDVGRRVGDLGGELGLGDGVGGLGPVDPGDRVDRDLGQRLWTLDGQLLDVHAALGRGHRKEGAVGAVEQVGEVVLLGDVAGLGDENPVHRMAFDVHP